MKRFGIISADSHVIEPPNAYVDYIDPTHRDLAPYMVRRDDGTDAFIVPGMDMALELGLGQMASIPPEQFSTRMAFGLHPASYDISYRQEVQERDGLDAEIIFSTMGLGLASNHPNPEATKHIFRAYNRWLAEYCAGLPNRVFGLAQTAMASPDSAIEDIAWARSNGFVGMMMPGDPGMAEYDHPMWDPVWACASDLRMPLAFHVFTAKSTQYANLIYRARGSMVHRYMSPPRCVQDTVALFVLSGACERYDNLRLVASEADAGWLPHFRFRLDKAYERHAGMLDRADLANRPSFYIDRQVWATQQTDWTVFRDIDAMPVDRIMWGSDYPHSDSTWPGSPEFLREHTKDLTGGQRAAMLRNNVIDCYELPLERAPDDVFLRDDGIPYEEATHRPLHGPTMVRRRPEMPLA